MLSMRPVRNATVLVVLFCLKTSLAGAQGLLNPPGPPTPTMKTLQQVYDKTEEAATTAREDASLVAQREGFARSYIVDPESESSLVTVPTGKHLVILKLVAVMTDLLGNPDVSNDDEPYAWDLSAGSTKIISGYINSKGSAGLLSDHDFPDRCVVVRAEETLKATNRTDEQNRPRTLHLNIVGYFYDVSE